MDWFIYDNDLRHERVKKVGEFTGKYPYWNFFLIGLQALCLPQNVVSDEFGKSFQKIFGRAAPGECFQQLVLLVYFDLALIKSY